MIEIINGYKRYGQKVILENINYKFEDGKMYGIVGANGSGKTVLLKSLAGYIKLTGGKVMQDDIEIRKNNNYIIDAGVVIENTQLINDYTLKDNLEYLKKMSKTKKDIDLEKWYEFFEIEKYKNTKFKNLSLGTKQKAGLIQAFMHEPHTLILDEPFNALDKKMAHKLEQYLMEKRREGRLIILITHTNDEIISKCDVALEISEGKFV